MNITVYLGSSMGNKKIYEDKVRELGKWIGENGHTLVYGGSELGLMGILADSVMDAGGEVIGVEIERFLKNKLHKKNITKMIAAPDFPERKRTLMELGDAYIAFPGGAGTLDEISEIICLMTVETITKPVIILNLGGYYESLISLLDHMVGEGFLSGSVRESILFVDDVEDIEDVLV